MRSIKSYNSSLSYILIIYTLLVYLLLIFTRIVMICDNIITNYISQYYV